LKRRTVDTTRQSRRMIKPRRAAIRRLQPGRTHALGREEGQTGPVGRGVGRCWRTARVAGRREATRAEARQNDAADRKARRHRPSPSMGPENPYCRRVLPNGKQYTGKKGAAPSAQTLSRRREREGVWMRFQHPLSIARLRGKGEGALRGDRHGRRGGGGLGRGHGLYCLGFGARLRAAQG